MGMKQACLPVAVRVMPECSGFFHKIEITLVQPAGETSCHKFNAGRETGAGHPVKRKGRELKPRGAQ